MMDTQKTLLMPADSGPQAGLLVLESPSRLHQPVVTGAIARRAGNTQAVSAMMASSVITLPMTRGSMGRTP